MNVKYQRQGEMEGKCIEKNSFNFDCNSAYRIFTMRVSSLCTACYKIIK